MSTNNTKTKTWPTRTEAFRQFTLAAQLARELCDVRNEDDQDLNETVTLVTDEENNRFTLTIPDQIEGVQILHFVWEA